MPIYNLISVSFSAFKQECFQSAAAASNTPNMINIGGARSNNTDTMKKNITKVRN